MSRTTVLTVQGLFSQPKPLLAFLLLLSGSGLAAVGLHRRRYEVVGAALAAAGITAWTLLNGDYEGAVLFVPFKGNGLTAADLLSAPAAAMVAVLVWRSVRR